MKSGAKGWQGKVREVYRSLEELQSYQDLYGIVTRLGYSSSETLWSRNPMIQGGTNPADLRVVKDDASPKVPKGYRHASMWAPLSFNLSGEASPDLRNLREKRDDAYAEGEGQPIKVLVVWQKPKRKK